MKNNNSILLCLIAGCLAISSVLISCNQEADLPQPPVEEQVDPPTPPDETPLPHYPEPEIVQTSPLVTAQSSFGAMSMLFTGTYSGTCRYVDSNYQTGGPVSSNSPGSMTITHIPGSNMISTGGGSTYSHISGTDPFTEVIKFRNYAYFPGFLSFDLKNNRLDYSWGASSPGGYSTQNCELYR